MDSMFAGTLTDLTMWRTQAFMFLEGMIWTVMGGIGSTKYIYNHDYISMILVTNSTL